MSKPEPANKNLYEKVKKEAKSKFEHWPSAYGSQWLVKTYKERGGTYTGGQKKETSGVTRWNKEKWTDEHGNICGSKNNKNIKKCRPSVRVTDSTPVTWSELTAKEKKAVISKKKQVGMGKKAPNIKRKTSPKRTSSPKRKTSPKRMGSPKRKTSPKRMSSPKRKTSPKRMSSPKRSWSTKYKKSINCNKPKGFSQKQYCNGKKRRG